MKYRTNEFFEREKYPKYVHLVPDFRLDTKTNQVVKVGDIDFQKKIQSADSDYRKLYDKFLENNLIDSSQSILSPNLNIDDGVSPSTNNILDDKLTSTMNLYNIAEDYKLRLNLEPTLTPEQVFNKLYTMSEELKLKNELKTKELNDLVAKANSIIKEDENVSKKKIETTQTS